MRTVCLIMIAAFTLLLSSPAEADPPERFELFFEFDFPDYENQLIGIMNIDRASWCTPDMVASEIAEGMGGWGAGWTASPSAGNPGVRPDPDSTS